MFTFVVLAAIAIMWYRAHTAYEESGAFTFRRRRSAWSWAFVGATVGSFFGLAGGLGFSMAVAATIPGALVCYLIADNIFLSYISPTDHDAKRYLKERQKISERESAAKKQEQTLREIEKQKKREEKEEIEFARNARAEYLSGEIQRLKKKRDNVVVKLSAALAFICALIAPAYLYLTENNPSSDNLISLSGSALAIIFVFSYILIYVTYGVTKGGRHISKMDKEHEKLSKSDTLSAMIAWAIIIGIGATIYLMAKST